MISSGPSANTKNFISVRIHLVCRVRRGFPLISDSLQPELWAVVGGILKRTGLKLYQVGGYKDHMHVFFGLPPAVPLATAVQSIMNKSAVWIRRQSNMASFQWQDSYGAFSVSASLTDATMAYIRRQKEHHKKRDFQEELIQIMQKHGVVPTELGVWVEA